MKGLREAAEFGAVAGEARRNKADAGGGIGAESGVEERRGGVDWEMGGE